MFLKADELQTVMNLNLTDKWMKCLKSEQATNPDGGKDGSVLNLGITIIPVCVCVSDKHTYTHVALCSPFNQSGGCIPLLFMCDIQLVQFP